MKPNKNLSEAAQRGRGMGSSSRLNDIVTSDELEVLKAVDWYKRHYDRSNPTVCEIMAIFAELGYRKAEPMVS
jgi:hypothetical protein